MKKVFIIFCLVLLSILAFPLKAETKQEIAKYSKSAILMEESTKTILYELNANEKLAPASMTKIMTMLLAMEALESGRIVLEEEVIISKNAAGMGGTQIFIEQNSKVKVSDLLKGIGIASANDAAVALAEKIGGTEENFVNMMNERAKQLGANDTNFKNPHGLDEIDHYTTAYDMALMASELVKYEDILKITSTYEEYINVSGKKHWLVNTNKLVRFYEGMDGLKTGYTDQAKYCLTSTMEKNDMRLVSVAMGADTKDNRNTDTINMMEYGFAMYGTKIIYEKDKKLGSIYINNSQKRNVDYYVSQDVKILVDKDTRKIDYDADTEFFVARAPLEKNNTIGKLTITYNDSSYEYDLIVKEDIKKSNYFIMLINNLKDIVSGNINIF